MYLCCKRNIIWRNLLSKHSVKEHKKSLLVTNYESFKMESHETIDKMYCKFNDLIKDLETLGKEYTLGEKNRKILNILSKE